MAQNTIQLKSQDVHLGPQSACSRWKRRYSMFHHILFPIDFSERCKEVVPLIRALANRYPANVTLMHVVQVPAGWYGGMEGALPIVFDLEATEQDATHKLVE